VDNRASAVDDPQPVVGIRGDALQEAFHRPEAFLQPAAARRRGGAHQRAVVLPGRSVVWRLAVPLRYRDDWEVLESPPHHHEMGAAQFRAPSTVDRRCQVESLVAHRLRGAWSVGHRCRVESPEVFPRTVAGRCSVVVPCWAGCRRWEADLHSGARALCWEWRDAWRALMAVCSVSMAASMAGKFLQTVALRAVRCRLLRRVAQRAVRLRHRRHYLRLAILLARTLHHWPASSRANR